MKKVIVVGATGRLGSVVVGGLKDYEVIRAGRSGPDLKIDALDFESASAALATIGPFDALISCAGVRAPFKPFEELTMEDFAIGISNKCLSQLNLVKAAIPYLTENGSITLTSGIIGDEPILGGSAAAAANGALNMCVSTLAAEYAGKLRINIVSPSIIENSVEHYGMIFDGFEPTSEKRIVEAYRRTISAPISGRVLCQTRSL